MNRRRVLALTGRLLLVEALFLLAPLGLAVVDGEQRVWAAYLAAAAITTACAMLFIFVGRHTRNDDLHRKDAFGTVALTWLCLGVFGGLPFVLDGSIPDPAGALFEAFSGFTTTGATVVADVGALNRATNLWRCLMHWLGGMGVVVLFVAVFPQVGIGAKQLFRTEVPGPSSEGLKPRIKQTALTLWWLYAALTALCVLALWALDMPLYDAVVHAFSTLGTGGFSNRSASIGHYQSAGVDWVTSLFMLLAGLNFGLYYGAVRGRWRELLSNSELRFYLLANAVLVAVVSATIWTRHDGLLDTLRYSVFQVLAVTTTTGFMTEDFDTYSDLARLMLFFAMFMGGCAGSTAGGLKAIRVLLLLRLAGREILSAVQPQAVRALRLGDHVVPEAVLSGVLVFTSTYLLLFSAGAVTMVALGQDLVTGASATIACLSSIGPGLAGVGPAQNFGDIPAVGKLVLSFCMLAGRLELFALFAVFSPACWRR
ncbi:MAG: TrkH family potassium uptake protein [Pseudomonadota bacterium]